MSFFKNKPLILEAIEESEIYTKGQKSILKILVSMAIGDVATVGTTYLMEQTGLSRAAVYLNLKKFVLEHLIEKIRRPAERQDSYKLNEEKLEYILQLYQNKRILNKK